MIFVSLKFTGSLCTGWEAITSTSSYKDKCYVENKVFFYVVDNKFSKLLSNLYSSLSLSLSLSYSLFSFLSPSSLLLPPT
jgi:hypothetical protein